MASCSPRKNKLGEIIGYQIKVSRGRDKITGKQLTPYTMTYTPPKGWSKKSIEKDLRTKMAEFEAACLRGEVLTKEEKKAKANEQAEIARRKREETQKKLTFNQYVEIFLREKATTLSSTTVQSYRQSLKRPQEVFGERKIEDISFLDVKQFVTELQSPSGKKKPLKHGTVVTYYTTLHTLFESAVENEVIEVNPMQRMKKPKARKDEIKEEALSYDVDGIRYIQDCLENEPLKWKALVSVLIDTGCRRGEAAGLKWEAVDLETGVMKICRNVQYTKEKGIFVTTPKNHQNRVIVLTPYARKLLREWKRAQTLEYFGRGLSTNGFCFTQDNGEMLNPNTITGYINRLGKRYNLPGLHAHTFRHSYASIAIRNGIDPVTVSKKLGHCNPSVTLNIYSHANEEAQRTESERMADILYRTQEKIAK